MIKIKHRVNLIDDLESLNPVFGAEVDISQGSELIIHTNPFQMVSCLKIGLNSTNINF